MRSLGNRRKQTGDSRAELLCTSNDWLLTNHSSRCLRLMPPLESQFSDAGFVQFTEALSQRRGIDVHDHVDQRLDLRGLAGRTDKTHRAAKFLEDRLGAFEHILFATAH